MPEESCAECATRTGTHRYCARLRCLCGHEGCWAYRTWRPRPTLDNVTPMREVA